MQPLDFWKNSKSVLYNFLDSIFVLFGILEEWLDKELGELLEDYTFIIPEANEVLRLVHDRMPVILKPESYDE